MKKKINKIYLKDKCWKALFTREFYLLPSYSKKNVAIIFFTSAPF